MSYCFKRMDSTDVSKVFAARMRLAAFALSKQNPEKAWAKYIWLDCKNASWTVPVTIIASCARCWTADSGGERLFWNREQECRRRNRLIWDEYPLATPKHDFMASVEQEKERKKERKKGRISTYRSNEDCRGADCRILAATAVDGIGRRGGEGVTYMNGDGLDRSAYSDRLCWCKGAGTDGTLSVRSVGFAG